MKNVKNKHMVFIMQLVAFRVIKQLKTNNELEMIEICIYVNLFEIDFEVHVIIYIIYR